MLKSRLNNIETADLKVVHISTSISGGAGIAAFRIHTALVENGFDSHFIYMTPTSFPIADSVSVFSQEISQTPANRVIRKVARLANSCLGIDFSGSKKYNSRLNQIKATIDCEILSLPFSNIDILDSPIVKDASIIHLHWVADMINYPAFFLKNQKPVLWTLHDMNPFLGLFHYKEDEQRNDLKTGTLNTEIAKLKSNVIKKRRSRLAIVGPSNWMLNQALQTETFSDVPGLNIRYPLDLNVFKPIEIENLKDELSILHRNTVLLFVAQTAQVYRKGFDLLMGALGKIKTLPVTLLVVGRPFELKETELDIRFLGKIENSETLAKYYSLADAFILPSREDNLPNVMLEALACGTPVLAFDTGGMSEIIRDGYNGLKAKTLSSDSLAETIQQFINTRTNFNSSEIRNFAVEHFSNEKIARDYIAAYKSLLNQDA